MGAAVTPADVGHLPRKEQVALLLLAALFASNRPAREIPSAFDDAAKFLEESKRLGIKLPE